MGRDEASGKGKAEGETLSDWAYLVSDLFECGRSSLEEIFDGESDVEGVMGSFSFREIRERLRKWEVDSIGTGDIVLANGRAGVVTGWDESGFIVVGSGGVGYRHPYSTTAFKRVCSLDDVELYMDERRRGKR